MSSHYVVILVVMQENYVFHRKNTQHDTQISPGWHRFHEGIIPRCIVHVSIATCMETIVHFSDRDLKLLVPLLWDSTLCSHD